MSYLFSWQYTTDTGVIIPGWQSNGSWVVGESGFGPSGSDGSMTAYTAAGKATSQSVSSTIYNDNTSTSVYSNINALLVLQDATDLNNCYAINFWFPNGTAKLYKIVGGGLNQVGGTMGIVGVSTGSPQAVTSNAILSGGKWQFGFNVNGIDYYPTDWADASPPWTSGYPGYYLSETGAAAQPYIKQLTITTTPDAIPTATTWVRPATTRAIAAGAAYNGVTPSDLQVAHTSWDAADSEFLSYVCFNAGTNYYPGGFFTTPDLVTWTYVNNSLIKPQSPSVVIGGAGIIRLPNTSQFGSNAGKYAFYTYDSSSVATNARFATSLTGFNQDHSAFTIINPANTNIIAAGTPDGQGQYDQHVLVNPVTGAIEIAYTGQQSSSIRNLMLARSSDGVTFGAGVVLYTGHTYDEAGPLGTPSVWYGNGPDGSANARYLTWDFGAAPGYVNKAMGWFPYLGSGAWSSTLRVLNIALYCDGANSYESGQVLDGGYCGYPGPFDRGDGNGPRYWHTYVGSNNNAESFGLNGCICVAYMQVPELVARGFRRESDGRRVGCRG